MAEHIEEGYEKRGTSKGEAERRAWATVNKETHGGKRMAPAGASPKTIHPPERVVILAAKLPHRVLPTSDRSPPRKRLLPGSGTLNTTLITR